MQEFLTHTYIIYLSLLENIISKQPATHIREETIRRKPTQKTTILTNRSLLKISILQQCPFNRKRLGKVMEQSKNMSSFWKVLLLLEGHRICLSTLLLLWRPCYGGCYCWKKSLLDRLSEFGDNLWPPESKTTANRMSSKKKPRYAIS